MATARNGPVELAYRVIPQTAGPRDRTLILIMGIDLTSAHWDEALLARLATHRRVIVFDNRGTGQSTRRVEAIDAQLWAADALAVLDAAGVDQADVLGYSMGARIAQQLAVHHKARVRSLVLVSSAVGSRDATPPQPEGMAALAQPPDLPPADAIRKALAMLAGPTFAKTHPQRLDALVEASLRQPTHASIVRKQTEVMQTHVTRELPSVTKPTLIVHGEVDPLVPIGNGELLHRLIPNAELHRIPNVGHVLPWEAPETLLEVVEAFLERPEP